MTIHNALVFIVYDEKKKKPRAWYADGQGFVRFPMVFRELGTSWYCTLETGTGGSFILLGSPRKVSHEEKPQLSNRTIGEDT